jgi:spore cortex biosynthesis protein YabQ
MDFINWQLSSMAILFVTGVFWGSLFDLHNYFKAKNQTGRVKRKSHFKDFCFWVVSLFLVGSLIYFANWLELRFYVWLCIGMGVIAYYCLFHRTLATALGLKG